MDLQRLPDELLLKICSYLEAFTLARLSKTCIRFKKFFTNNSGCRHLKFDRQFGLRGTHDEMRSLIIQNKIYITHLDISFIRWLKKSQIQKMIAALPNLKHVNLMETGLASVDIEAFLKVGRSITSVGMSFDRPNTVPELDERIKRLHLYANEESRICISSKYFANLEMFKLTSCYNCMLISRDLGSLKEMFIEIINPTQGVDVIFTKVTGIPRPPANFVLYIEGIQNIYLSDELVSEFKDERIRGKEQEYVFRIYGLSKYTEEHYVIAYYCDKTSPVHYERFRKKINERLNIRSSKVLSFYGSTFCPLYEFIPQCIPEKNNVTNLSIQACCLKSLTKPFNQEISENKGRVSKMFKAPIENCALNKILSVMPNVETLQIRGFSTVEIKCRSSSGIFNSSYLSSISKLTKLKYLNLSFPHFLRPEVFVDIFINCTLLSTLLINSCTDEAQQMMYMAKKIYLCKNLKTFELQCTTDNVQEILNCLSDCPLLENVYISYKALVGDNQNCKLDESTVRKLVEKCPGLGVLIVLSVPLMLGRAHLTRQRKLEKAARSVRPNIDVNFSKSRYHREGLADMVGNFVR